MTYLLLDNYVARPTAELEVFVFPPTPNDLGSVEIYPETFSLFFSLRKIYGLDEYILT